MENLQAQQIDGNQGSIRGESGDYPGESRDSEEMMAIAEH